MFNFTDCSICLHEEICKYRNNMKNEAEILAMKLYDDSNETDMSLNYEDEMALKNVTLEFTCKNFRGKQGGTR